MRTILFFSFRLGLQAADCRLQHTALFFAQVQSIQSTYLPTYSTYLALPEVGMFHHKAGLSTDVHPTLIHISLTYLTLPRYLVVSLS